MPILIGYFVFAIILDVFVWRRNYRKNGDDAISANLSVITANLVMCIPLALVLGYLKTSL